MAPIRHGPEIRYRFRVTLHKSAGSGLNNQGRNR